MLTREKYGYTSISFDLTPAELDALRAKAQATDRSLAYLARKATLDMLIADGATLEPRDRRRVGASLPTRGKKRASKKAAS